MAWWDEPDDNVDQIYTSTNTALQQALAERGITATPRTDSTSRPPASSSRGAPPQPTYVPTQNTYDTASRQRSSSGSSSTQRATPASSGQSNNVVYYQNPTRPIQAGETYYTPQNRELAQQLYDRGIDVNNLRQGNYQRSIPAEPFTPDRSGGSQQRNNVQVSSPTQVNTLRPAASDGSYLVNRTQEEFFLEQQQRRQQQPVIQPGQSSPAPRLQSPYRPGSVPSSPYGYDTYQTDKTMQEALFELSRSRQEQWQRNAPGVMYDLGGPAQVDYANPTVDTGPTGVSGGQVQTPTQTTPNLATDIARMGPQTQEEATTSYTYDQMIGQNLTKLWETTANRIADDWSDAQTAGRANFFNPIGPLQQQNAEAVPAQERNATLLERAYQLQGRTVATDLPPNALTEPYLRQAEAELGYTYDYSVEGWDYRARQLGAFWTGLSQNVGQVPGLGNAWNFAGNTLMTVAEGIGGVTRIPQQLPVPEMTRDEALALDGMMRTNPVMAVSYYRSLLDDENRQFLTIGERVGTLTETLLQPGKWFTPAWQNGTNPIAAFAEQDRRNRQSLLDALWVAPGPGEEYVDSPENQQLLEARANATVLLDFSGPQSAVEYMDAVQNREQRLEEYRQRVEASSQAAANWWLSPEERANHAYDAAQAQIAYNNLLGMSDEEMALGYIKPIRDAILSTVTDITLWLDVAKWATNAGKGLAATGTGWNPNARRLRKSLEIGNMADAEAMNLVRQVMEAAPEERSVVARALVEGGLSRVSYEQKTMRSALGTVLSGVDNKEDIPVILNAIANDLYDVIENGIDVAKLHSERLKILAENGRVTIPEAQALALSDLGNELMANLKAYGNQWQNLVSLKDSKATLGDVMEEIMRSTEIASAERHGVGKLGKQPPLGTTEVRIERNANNAGELIFNVEYVDKDGTVLARSPWGTEEVARREVAAYNQAIKSGDFLETNYVDAFSQWARRSVSVPLIYTRPGSWVRNAVGGWLTGMSTASNTLMPIADINEFIAKNFVDIPFDYLRPDSIGQMSEAGGVFKVGPLKGLIEKAQRIRGGQTELPGGIAFGENAFKTKAWFSGSQELSRTSIDTLWRTVVEPALASAETPSHALTFMQQEMRLLAKDWNIAKFMEDVTQYAVGNRKRVNLGDYGQQYSSALPAATQRRISDLAEIVESPEQLAAGIRTIIDEEIAKATKVAGYEADAVTLPVNLEAELADAISEVQIAGQRIAQGGGDASAIPSITQRIRDVENSLERIFMLSSTARNSEAVEIVADYYMDLQVARRDVQANLDNISRQMAASAGNHGFDYEALKAQYWDEFSQYALQRGQETVQRLAGVQGVPTGRQVANAPLGATDDVVDPFAGIDDPFADMEMLSGRYEVLPDSGIGPMPESALPRVAPGISSDQVSAVVATQQPVLQRIAERNATTPDALVQAGNDAIRPLTQAPVAVQVDVSAIDNILETGGLRNSFETGKTSPGKATDFEFRKQAEAQGLGIPEGAPANERPIYGYLLLNEKQRSALASPYLNTGYGDITVVLKDDVRPRTTYTVGDSNTAFAGNRMLGLQLDEVSPLGWAEETGNVWDYAQSGNLDELIDNVGYLETQTSGGVQLADMRQILDPKSALTPEQVQRFQDAGIEVVQGSDNVQAAIPAVGSTTPAPAPRPQRSATPVSVQAAGSMNYKLISGKRIDVPALTPAQEAAAQALAQQISESGDFATPLIVISEGGPANPRYVSAGFHENSRAAQILREQDPRKWENIPARIVDTPEQAQGLLRQMGRAEEVQGTDNVQAAIPAVGSAPSTQEIAPTFETIQVPTPQPSINAPRPQPAPVATASRPVVASPAPVTGASSVPIVAEDITGINFSERYRGNIFGERKTEAIRNFRQVNDMHWQAFYDAAQDAGDVRAMGVQLQIQQDISRLTAEAKAELAPLRQAMEAAEAVEGADVANTPAWRARREARKAFYTAQADIEYDLAVKKAAKIQAGIAYIQGMPDPIVFRHPELGDVRIVSKRGDNLAVRANGGEIKIIKAEGIDAKTLEAADRWMQRVDSTTPDKVVIPGMNEGLDKEIKALSRDYYDDLRVSRDRYYIANPGMGDVQADTILLLDSLRRKADDIAAGTFNTAGKELDPRQLNAILDAANQVRKQWGRVRTAATEYGDKVAGWHMIDMSRSYRPDQALQLMFPYHTFTTRTFKNLVERLATQSAVRHAFDIESAFFEERNGDPAKQYVEVNVGGQPLRMYASLSGYTMGVYNWDRNTNYYEQQQIDGPLGAAFQVEKAVGAGLYPTFDFADAMIQDPYWADNKGDYTAGGVAGTLARSFSRSIGNMPWGQTVKTLATLVAAQVGMQNIPGRFITDQLVDETSRVLASKVQNGEITETQALYAGAILYSTVNNQPYPEQMTPEQITAAEKLLNGSITEYGVGRLVTRITSDIAGLTTVPLTPGRQSLSDAQSEYYDVGYPQNPAGGRAAQGVVREQNPGVTTYWMRYNIKEGDESPAVQARRTEYYDAINAIYDKQSKEIVDTIIGNSGRYTPNAEIKAIRDKYEPEIDALKAEYKDALSDTPFEADKTKMNPAERALFELEAVLRYDDNKPPMPTDDMAPDEQVDAWAARDKWEAARLDYIERTMEQYALTDNPAEWVEKFNAVARGEYASELVRKYLYLKNAGAIEKKWDHFSSIEREMSNLAYDTLDANVENRLGKEAARKWKIYEAQGESGSDERRTYADDNPEITKIRVARFNPEAYDAATNLFGSTAWDTYIAYKDAKPEYPGDDADPKVLTAYRDKLNALNARYPQAAEIQFWVEGRYHWFDAWGDQAIMSTERNQTRTGAYGADYAKATALFGEDIFEVAAKIPYSKGSRAVAQYYDAHPELEGFNAWKKQYSELPGSVEELQQLNLQALQQQQPPVSAEQIADLDARVAAGEITEQQRAGILASMQAKAQGDLASFMTEYGLYNGPRPVGSDRQPINETQAQKQQRLILESVYGAEQAAVILQQQAIAEAQGSAITDPRYQIDPYSGRGRSYGDYNSWRNYSNRYGGGGRRYYGGGGGGGLGRGYQSEVRLSTPQVRRIYPDRVQIGGGGGVNPALWSSLLARYRRPGA